MREDIVAGLRNAYERGESVEKAVSAFISAGYNSEEVKEAAKYLGFSYPQQEQNQQAIPKETTKFQPLPKSPSLTKELPLPTAPSPPQTSTTTPNLPPVPKPKLSRKLKIFNIILGTIVLILFIVVGISAWNLLKGQWIVG